LWGVKISAAAEKKFLIGFANSKDMNFLLKSKSGPINEPVQSNTFGRKLL
jgi:hypothetical protein